MKRMLTVLAAVMAAAVVQVATAAGLSFTIADDGKTADFAFEASHLQRKLYVAYGLSDGGSSTNGWENVELVATIPAGVTALDDVALPAGFGVDAPVMRPFIEKPMTAADYVQDNLIVLYDGIENAGWGQHDANAKTWRNLVATAGNTDTDISIAETGDSVEADHISFGAVGRTTVGNVTTSYNQRNITVELNANFTWVDSGNKNDIGLIRVGSTATLGFDSRAAVVVWTTKESATTWHITGMGDRTSVGNLDSYVSDGLYRTFTGSAHTYDYKWAFLNGTQLANVNTIYSETASRPDVRNLEIGHPRAKFNARSVRIYSGIWNTDAGKAVLAQNHKVDEARFGGKVPLEGAQTLGYAKVPFSVRNVVTENNAIKSIDVVFTGKDMPRRLYLAYARRDAGTSADNWQNVVKVCNVTSGMAGKTIVLSDLGIMLPDSNGFRVFMDCTSADDYVKDNLVLLYDGIENAGWGTHDANAKFWRNLVAAEGKTDTDLAIDKDGDAVADDHVVFGNVLRTTAGDVLSAADNDEWNRQDATLQLNAQMIWYNTNDNNDITLFRLGGCAIMAFDGRASISMWTPRKTTTPYWHVIGYGKTAESGNIVSYVEDGKYRTFTGCEHIQEYKWCFIDGQMLQNSNTIYADNITRPTTLDVSLGSPKVKFSARSVRIYKGRIQAADNATLVHNNKVDETRFGNGGPVHIEGVTDFWKVRRGLFIVVQ